MQIDRGRCSGLTLYAHRSILTQLTGAAALVYTHLGLRSPVPFACFLVWQLGGFQAGIVKSQLTQLRRQFTVYKSEVDASRLRITKLSDQRNQDALVVDEVMRQWTQVCVVCFVLFFVKRGGG